MSSYLEMTLQTMKKILKKKTQIHSTADGEKTTIYDLQHFSSIK